METILLVILIIIAVVMIGIILIQRSEGGALGIGGGGPGALFSARGSANLLTRVTAVLAALFMVLSLVLAVIAGGGDGGSVLDRVEDAPPIEAEPAPDLTLPGEEGIDFTPDEGLPADEMPLVPRAD